MFQRFSFHRYMSIRHFLVRMPDSGSFLDFLLDLVSVLVDVFPDVSQAPHNACTEGAAVDSHFGAVVP